MLMNQIKNSVAWTSKTFDYDKSFLHVHEFLPALVNGFDNDDFLFRQALKGLADRVVNICEDGQGVVVLRGLDTIYCTDTKLLDFYKKLCALIGSLVSQNSNGDKVVSVSNKRAGNLLDKNVRAYNTDQALNFHSDSADITGLLCINNSQQGGESMVVSAATIHNLILADHKELLGIFYHGFIYDARGEEIIGSSPAYRNSVFHYGDKKLSCRFYLSDYIVPGLRKLGLSLSEIERHALEVFSGLCDQPTNHISFKMGRGDIVFYSNNTVLHARQPFVSTSNSNTDRLLYRTWINPYEHRSFPKDFAKYRFGYDNFSSRAMDG
ncbi:TauD/TfdA family dioxygenase [Pseudomonas syringae]|nr:TauD/TfdA family dioxygenase [Pseudomonas syringae]